MEDTIDIQPGAICISSLMKFLCKLHLVGFAFCPPGSYYDNLLFHKQGIKDDELMLSLERIGQIATDIMRVSIQCVTTSVISAIYCEPE